MMDAVRYDGYEFNVVNWQKQGAMLSQTIRMYKNTRDLYWTNIIHESLEDCFVDQLGRKKRLCDAPTKLFNEGMRSEQQPFKLAHYKVLCERQVKQDPRDGRGYLNLGLYYTNDGPENKEFDKGMGMLMQAAQLKPQADLPQQQLGMNHCQLATRYFLRLFEILPNNHYFKPKCRQWLKMLNSITLEIKDKKNGGR